MLLDKPLRLCHGAGNGVDTACLMTATNMLIGCGNKGDEAVCVCPVLRAFIITTNDCMPDALRQELYGPLPWLLIGTKTDDIGVMVRRAEILSDAAQELAEYAEYAAKSAKYAAESAKYAAEYAAEYAAKSAKYAAEYAKYAAEYAAEYAAKDAKYAAEYAAAERRIWTICRDALVRAAEVGSKTPTEIVMTPDEICAALSK